MFPGSADIYSSLMVKRCSNQSALYQITRGAARAGKRNLKSSGCQCDVWLLKKKKCAVFWSQIYFILACLWDFFQKRGATLLSSSEKGLLLDLLLLIA